VRPDNIGFDSNGTLKLFGFGSTICAAKGWFAHKGTRKYNIIPYQAPEVSLGLNYNFQVDVYSYAITLWQMATDEVPFDGMSQERYTSLVVERKVRPDTFFNCRWPNDFCTLLDYCWHWDIHSRYTFTEVDLHVRALLRAHNASRSS